MAQDFVIFNGVKMAAKWPAKIVEAQTVTTYVINGTTYNQSAMEKRPKTGVQIMVL
jgi:hypothetical protein